MTEIRTFWLLLKYHTYWRSQLLNYGTYVISMFLYYSWWSNYNIRVVYGLSLHDLSLINTIVVTSNLQHVILLHQYMFYSGKTNDIPSEFGLLVFATARDAVIVFNKRLCTLRVKRKFFNYTYKSLHTHWTKRHRREGAVFAWRF